METKRQSRVNSLLEKELGQILNQEKYIDGKLVTVSGVRVSPDLQLAKVYLSIFPSENANEDLKLVLENKSRIRFLLGNLIRHQLRVVPELNFYVDDSLDYIENIDALLKDNE
jgi:ribosome-binding factor A